jgi:hypothetical protein
MALAFTDAGSGRNATMQKTLEAPTNSAVNPSFLDGQIWREMKIDDRDE